MAEGPVSGRKVKRKTVRQIVFAAIVIGIVIAIVKGTSVYFQYRAEKAEKDQLQKLQTIAQQVASKVSISLKEANSEVNKLAQSQDVYDLVIDSDKEALKIRADELVSTIPSALKLRFLLPGQYQLDREASPPLGYASLALLKRAEKSPTKIDIELHKFKTPDAHIVLVQRIEDVDKNLVGLIHLSLDAAIGTNALDEQDISGSYIELSQAVGDKLIVLANKGDKKFRGGTPGKKRINGTSWNVTVWAGKADLSASAEPYETANTDLSSIIKPAIICLLLAIVIIGFFLYRKKQGTVDEDSVIYQGAVKAIMEGQHPGFEGLVPDLPKMGLTKPIKPVSQGLVGDDITVVVASPSETKAQPVKAKAAPARKPTAETEQVPSEATTVPVQPEQIAEAKTDADVSQDTTTEPTGSHDLTPEIFRAYDIRGVVGKDLSASGVHDIGQAIGSEAEARGEKTVIVGRDGRDTSPELAEALMKGLRDSGRDVIDIGMIPTPVLYFATHHFDTNSGIMVTGSHNDPEYNGLKIVLAGEPLAGDAIQALYTRHLDDDITTGTGELKTEDITAEYIRRVTEDIPVALSGAFKIVVDCGNGVAGVLAPQIFRAMGHDVIELYCEVDGKFPNHQPDPSQPENLEALIAKVKEEEADLGLAFDGDGDRLGVVDNEGTIIWPDRQMMMFARDVLSRNEGATIVFDVKCSNHLKAVIESSGGKPLMWKTGHSLLKAKMKEEDAPLAGEMSGHIFFKERWYGFDDAIYAGARLLEILTKGGGKPAEVFSELPGGVATPELRIPLEEKAHKKFMDTLTEKISFEDAEIIDIDGVRVDLPYGWGLIRPSNTSPNIIVRFEGEDEETLHVIQSQFRELIQSIDPDLKLPF